MNLAFSDEQRMLQETLRRALEKSPQDSWSQLAELGVFAALFSEQQGGLGGSGTDLAIVFQELGRAGVTDPVLDSVLYCGRLLEAFDTQSELLKRVIDADVQLAFAHTEVRARYTTNHVETQVANHVIDGRKTVVMNAARAEYFLLSVRSAGSADDVDGICLYLVPAGSDGITVYDYEVSAGGQAADVHFNQVQLSAEHCLADDAYSVIDNATAAATVAQCAETLGAMETAMSMTCDYLSTRQQFGRPLATFQALAHRVADMLIELEQARSAVMLAAGHLDSDMHTRDIHISAAKNLLGRVGKLIAEESIQLHGGIGMTAEYRLGDFAKKIILADHRFGDVDYHLERFIALDRASTKN